MKRLFRPGGVNFRVDLHNDRLGGIKDSSSKKSNIKLMQEKLRKAGVNDDFLKDLMRDNSPVRAGGHGAQHRGYL